MQPTRLPELMGSEAEAARQLAALTGLPLARVIRLVTRSKFWRSRFVMVTYSAATVRAWSDSTGHRDAPLRQQEHLRDFAASLMETAPCNGPSPSR